MIEPQARPREDFRYPPQRQQTPWLSCPRPNLTAPLRLLCLPYAGGGGSVFRSWPAGLDGVAEVCPVVLPGREARFRERPFTRMEPLLDSLQDGISRHLDRPFAIFGHSMGALIAFELARALQRDRGVSPVCLIVSGSRPPHASFADADVHGLPDEEFLECLHSRYHAIPDIVRQNRELAEIVMPALRADFELLETYRLKAADRVACPIVALGGTADQTVRPDELQAWSRHTEGEFRCRLFDGDHFFIRSAESDLLKLIDSELKAAARSQ